MSILNAGELLPNWGENCTWPEMCGPREMFPDLTVIEDGCDWLSTMVAVAIQANDPRSYEMGDI